MLDARRKKLFRVARKIQSSVYQNPEFALRNAARLSRICNGHSPFTDIPSPLDPKEGGFTEFQTSIGKVRVL